MNQVSLILAVSAFALSNIASAKSDEAVVGNQASPNQAMVDRNSLFQRRGRAPDKSTVKR